MHISNVKLPFYPPCEVKYGLQNRVSTTADQFAYIQGQITALSSQIDDLSMTRGSDSEFDQF